MTINPSRRSNLECQPQTKAELGDLHYPASSDERLPCSLFQIKWTLFIPNKHHPDPKFTPESRIATTATLTHSGPDMPAGLVTRRTQFSSCDECRRSRVACDAQSSEGTSSCTRCRNRHHACTFKVCDYQGKWFSATNEVFFSGFKMPRQTVEGQSAGRVEGRHGLQATHRQHAIVESRIHPVSRVLIQVLQMT